MRKFLLATTAAAVVLTFTGRVFAETNLQLLLRKSITVIDQPQTTGQGSRRSSAEPQNPPNRPRSPRPPSFRRSASN